METTKKQLTAEDLFDSTKFIIVRIYDSMAYGVSIKAAIRGQVRPSSIGDTYYQKANPEKFVELSNLDRKDVDALCLKHKGMETYQMRQFVKR